MGTYVLTADRPDGPFRFAEGEGLSVPGEGRVDSGERAVPEARGLVSGEGRADSPAIINDIDGEPFIDDDGTGYIFWRRRNGARLSADRLHLEGETVTLKTAG